MSSVIHILMTLENRDARVAKFEVKIIIIRSDFVVEGLQAFPSTT